MTELCVVMVFLLVAIRLELVLFQTHKSLCLILKTQLFVVIPLLICLASVKYCSVHYTRAEEMLSNYT